MRDFLACVAFKATDTKTAPMSEHLAGKTPSSPFRGQFPDELHCSLNPWLHLSIVLDALRFHHQPALHRFAGDVEFLDMLLQQRLLVAFRADTNDHRVLPDTHEHVAIQQEADAAKHFLLIDALLAD
jgi:hypothetical protein